MHPPLHNPSVHEIVKEKRKKVHKHKCIYAGHKFNYDDPVKWSLLNRQCTEGQKQSPIALFSRKVQPDDIAPILFQYYDVPLTGPIDVHNNGRTVFVTIHNTIDGTHPSITGAGATDVYEVINIHFHWGSKGTTGTEHAINGKKYDMEMHIVHRNARFKTMKEALEDPCGFIVLAILFEKSPKSNSKTAGLNAVFDALPYLKEYNSTVLLKQSFTMRSFIGDLNTDQFFMYRGSLTTPPCPESVTWIIFTDILKVKSDYLPKFNNLCDERGMPLLHTCRPLQSSFLRRIYFRQGGE